MTRLQPERLAAYQALAFRLVPGRSLVDRADAVDYVNERGFIYFWPIKGIQFPSLWSATAGDRTVADEHDDPGHVTWKWKDSLLDQRVWHYAKVLRQRATLISLECLPYFYALSDNYGEPDRDYLFEYREGRLSHEAKTLYETLLVEGPLNTIDLRQKARMTSESSNASFNRAMDQLQAGFKVMPVGVARAGAWKYAFIWEMVHRHYPDLPQQARNIRQRTARSVLARRYLESLGAATAQDASKLLGWPPGEIRQALQDLEEAGVALPTAAVGGRSGDWYALSELASCA